jgi:histidinol-phosphate aminotransferase
MNQESVFIRNTTPEILSLKNYLPGPTTAEISRAAGVQRDKIVKLSSNENPLGPSPKVVDAICHAATNVSLYPSSVCKRLRDALSLTLGNGLSAENILVAAGSSEIFSFIIRAFSKPSDEVIYGDPGFSVYSDCAIVDSRISVPIPLSAPLFEFKAEAVRSNLTTKTKIIMVTRPNNPTSRLVPLKQVETICEDSPNSVVVCDEAYVEFADNYQSASAVNLIGKIGNLLVTRTFSKAYGLSDLRIGYLIGPREAVEILFKVRPKWNNGELAQEAAIAALNDREHLTRTLSTVQKGRRYLSEQLAAMGFIVTPEPQGNFVFVSPSPLGIKAETLHMDLMKDGIAIRGPPTDWTLDYLRISVGTEQENKKLVAAIRRCIRGQPTRA